MEVHPAAGCEELENVDSFASEVCDPVAISAAMLSRLPAGGNAIISPLSVAFLAAMSCAGGQWFDVDSRKVLNVYGEEMDYFEDSYWYPSWSTTAFVAENTALEGEYRKSVNRLTQGVYRLDFSRGREAARQQINKLVGEKTAGRIQTALAPGAIASDASVVLLNASHFDGLCKEPFDAKETRAADFRVGPGKTVTVQMMRLTSYFRYGVDKARRLQLLVLPYSEKVETLLILPFGGVTVEDTLRLLNGSVLSELYKTCWPAVSVEVALPRFSVSSFVDVTSGLKELGIRRAFGYTSNRSAASPARNPCELACLHRAVIKVSEAGTRAAVHASEIARCMVWPEMFICNRPFVFALRVNEKAVLLIGRVCNPNLDAEK